MTLRLAVAVAALAATSVARAGVVMEMQVAPGGDGPKGATSTMQIEGNKLRVEVPGKDPKVPEHVMIFDGDSKTMTSVEPGSRSYFQITAAEMKAMSERAREQAKAAREKTRAALEKLPPEQRKQVEGMLKKQEEAAKPKALPKFSFEKTGKAGKAAGHSCDWYKQFEDGEFQGQGCFVPLRRLGLSVKDFQAFDAMRDFYGTSAQDVPSRMDFAAVMAQAPGFPVIAAQEEDGKVKETMRFTRIAKESVPASRFAPPDGYERKKVPGTE
jgi:hypothetical protein